ncbi:acnB [Acrasis kona]|uniref:AcnB n=1 Tax=Acrasis kona TaxID=1008807 RepID=A0AAW2Z727_9EUKA
MHIYALSDDNNSQRAVNRWKTTGGMLITTNNTLSHYIRSTPSSNPYPTPKTITYNPKAVQNNQLSQIIQNDTQLFIFNNTTPTIKNEPLVGTNFISTIRTLNKIIINVYEDENTIKIRRELSSANIQHQNTVDIELNENGQYEQMMEPPRKRLKREQNNKEFGMRTMQTLQDQINKYADTKIFIPLEPEVTTVYSDEDLQHVKREPS